MNTQNMEVLINTIGAVESGGQIYGSRDYAAYADPYAHSPEEHTITLGWAQSYGNNARQLIQRIHDMDPDGFRKIDTRSSVKKTLEKDWEAAHYKPTAAQKKILLALLVSDAGKRCQDDLFAEQMTGFVSDCEKRYTSDVKAVMMYCEIRHLGGESPVNRIFDRLNGDYSLDAVMASLVRDQRDSSSDNQVGDSKYWSRHLKCREFIDMYAVPEGDDGQMVTAEQIINIYRSWIGLSRASGTHAVILDIYNQYIREHPGTGRGYQVRASDAYCATTFSAAFIKLGAVSLIGGIECGVEEQVKICKAAGIWEEDGRITPKPGYGIVYNWDDTTQPNDGYSDHIGIVESVSGGYITCIEGNMNGGVVGRRTIPVGWGYIRGYIKPKYSTASESQKTEEPGIIPALSKARKWTGIVPNDTAVYVWVGTENHQTAYSPIKAGAVVDVCDTAKDTANTDWYYIRYNGKYGFISAAQVLRKDGVSAAPTTPTDQIKKVTASYGASIGPDKAVAGTYKTTVDLNVRNRAGTDTAKGCTIIGSIPKGTRVKNYGFYSMVGGVKWLYVQATYGGITYTGHCSGNYLKKT